MGTNPKDRDYNDKINREFEKGAGKFSDQDLDKVLRDEETARKKAKNLKGLFDEFITGLNLLKDFKNGSYKAPWKLIAAIGFAVVYLVSPVDLIPDVIPVLGFTDDFSVFAFVAKSFRAEIEEYQKWKNNQIDV